MRFEIPEEKEDGGMDPGIDFAYSDRKGHWVAVELKFSTSSNENLVRQGLAQMQHFVEAHSIQFDRAELWLLDKSNLLLSVWSTTKEEPIGSYGLANVVSTTAGASSERRRPVPLDSNEVEQRVAEWRQHILVLFKDMTEWSIRNEYATDQTQTVLMDEELMQLFAVPAVHLPVLKVLKGRSTVATIVPVGLWVIGANGRLDVLTATTTAMITNASADPNAVRWLVYPGTGGSGEPLNEQRFLRLIT